MADKYADRIAEELVLDLKNKGSIVFKEYFYNGFRSDVLALNSSYDVVEYEIKTSVADYKNDFSKFNKSLENKHSLLEAGKLANEFYFVFPPNLILEKDVPEYCGIIHYVGGHFEVIRESGVLYPIELCEKYNFDILNTLVKNGDYVLISEFYKYRSESYKKCYEHMYEMNTKWFDIVQKVKKIVSPNPYFQE